MENLEKIDIMNKKKILIISRTIFPSQFPRSLRATELAKELARQGHDVTLYAVLGKFDYAEFEKTFNLKVRDIGKMHFTNSTSDGAKKNNFINKILSKLFNDLIEFPDIELCFKIPSIFKKERNADMLITIAIPYPLHWGAAWAKSRHVSYFPKSWIADCGDPYMGNEFHKPYFYFKYIEKWFCRNADYITVPIDGAKEAYYKEFQNKIRVIPQGFDFDEIKIDYISPNNAVPTFAYSGSFYKGIRDPQLFLEYLSTLNQDFKFIVFTKKRSFIEPFLEKLGNKIELRDYILREDLLPELSKMDFLVNFENGTEVHSPSKLIDYALVKRPILSVSSNSLKKETINDFLNGNYKDQLKIENVEQYNIKNVAKEFLKLAKDFEAEVPHNFHIGNK